MLITTIEPEIGNTLNDIFFKVSVRLEQDDGTVIQEEWSTVDNLEQADEAARRLREYMMGPDVPENAMAIVAMVSRELAERAGRADHIAQRISRRVGRRRLATVERALEALQRVGLAVCDGEGVWMAAHPAPRLERSLIPQMALAMLTVLIVASLVAIDLGWGGY